MYIMFHQTFFSFFSLIKVQLIYNVVLVSGVQQSDSVIYTFFSIIGYYKILNIVLYRVGPCHLSIHQTLLLSQCQIPSHFSWV